MSNNLKNKLDQESLDFDTSAAWEQLAPKLESKKRKRRGLIWWWIGGSSVAVLLVFAMNYSTGGFEFLEQQESRSSHDAEQSAEPIADVMPNSSKLLSDIADVSVKADESDEIAQVSSLEMDGKVLSQEIYDEIETGTSTNEIDFRKVESRSPIARRDAQFSYQNEQNPVVSTFRKSKVKFLENSSSSTSLNFELEEEERGLEKLTPVFAQTSNEQVDLLSELDCLDLSLLEVDQDVLGPLPRMRKSRVPYGRLSAKPYWQVGVLAGVGKEMLSPTTTDSMSRVVGRNPLETWSLQLGLTRSFNRRLAVTVNAHLLQRKELYRTDFLLSQVTSQLYNPEALRVGGEVYGSIVEVTSEERLQSDRYASFTRFNVGASAAYLLPTRLCDYSVFGGVNYALLQRWNGTRRAQRDGLEIVEDTRGPYFIEGGYRNRMSFAIGARASKPLGSQLQLMFDSRAVISSRYNIESAFNEIFTETGHTFTVSLGLGYRFE